MKVCRCKLILVFLLAGIIQVYAQPFTLDKNIKPIELKLQKDTRKGNEGGKFIATLSTVDSIKYYYVKGHDLFQFVDVLVKGFGNKNSLEASLVYDNWNDLVEKQSTQSAKDGIVHFKVRAFGSFGLKIVSPLKETINYTIMVRASPQQKTYLGSPFSKIKDSEMKAGNSTVSDSSGSGSSNNVLYIILGICLLVIGLLVGKLLSKKSATIIVLLLALPLNAPAQNGATPGFFYRDRYYNGEDLDNGKFEEDLENEMGDGYNPKKDIENLYGKLQKIKQFLDVTVNLYNNYKGLGNCINSVPPRGEPRIPSFCDIPNFSDENGCADCFLKAREEFNDVRYLFEQLATIYKCTKNFSNAALSFGDNTSGVHAVAGMAWQAERRNIEKSISELENAYDKKYAELLQSLSDAMLKLSECEARFGVEDWFDRFGFMYFEFMRDKYQRKS